jgi:RimJ/RimL family protein N-acetyltransferase
MWADPAVTQYISGRVFTPQETWSKMLAYAGLWSLLGYGYWAIEERASGLFVGDLGFANFKREIEPSMEGLPEAGWVLGAQFFGRGYATEALRAALRWHDQGRPPADRTVCIIAPANRASVRVAEKCGYALLATTTFRDEPVLMFSRPASVA